jgi:osmotically-inducible protein OsmY
MTYGRDWERERRDRDWERERAERGGPRGREGRGGGDAGAYGEHEERWSQGGRGQHGGRYGEPSYRDSGSSAYEQPYGHGRGDEGYSEAGRYESEQRRYGSQGGGGYSAPEAPHYSERQYREQPSRGGREQNWGEQRGGYGSQGYGSAQRHGSQSHGSSQGGSYQGGYGSQSGGSQGYGSQSYGPQGGYGRPSSSGMAGEWGEFERSRGSATRGQGQHRGKGPKGYRRTDERVREDISERLKDHDEIDASEIEVEVANGEVTLKGEVADRHEKWMAEECAYQVSGVGEVNNQLRLHKEKQSEAGERSGQGAGQRGEQERSGGAARGGQQQQRSRTTGSSASTSS